MRPPGLFWLQLLVAAAAAAVEPTTPAVPTPAAHTAAATAVDATPVPATPTAAHPLASLFFPNAVANQMRAFDGGAEIVPQSVPWLASLARSFPSSLRAFDRQPVQSREAVSAIEEFTGPLVRFATGGQPVAADVEQLIDSIPHLARSANALKEADKVNLSSMDFSTLPSELVTHVLNGGQIPGIDRAELDRVVREHLKRMSEAADRIISGEKVENVEKILPPLNKVPVEMIMSSLQGKALPGLTAAETAKIREYYTKLLPLQAPSDANVTAPLPEALSALGKMVQALPPGYDIGKIPPEIMQSMVAGRVPDLSLLPADLQAYISAGKDQAMAIVKSLNSSVAEIVQHLAASVEKLPEVQRAAAYDISKVTHEVIDVEAVKEKHARNVLYTIAWVALAFAVAAIVAFWLLYKKFADPSRKILPSSLTPPARSAHPEDDTPFRTGADAAASPRRRFVASPQGVARVQFDSQACRFSTPKLVLNSPQAEKATKATPQKAEDVVGDKAELQNASVNDSDAIYDTTQ